MKNLWITGLVAQTCLVVALSTGAYLGLVPTEFAALPGLDKIAHALLIGGVAFFLDGALSGRKLLAARGAPPLAAALVLVVAGIEEYAQRFSARRTSSVYDFFADLVGVAFFCWLAARVRRGEQGPASRLAAAGPS